MALLILTRFPLANKEGYNWFLNYKKYEPVEGFCFPVAESYSSFFQSLDLWLRQLRGLFVIWGVRSCQDQHFITADQYLLQLPAGLFRVVLVLITSEEVEGPASLAWGLRL